MPDRITHCTNFFERIDDDFCVNWDVTPMAYYDRGGLRQASVQWCYVSPECTKLGYGNKINGNLSYKTCESPADRKTNKVTPVELQKIATKSNISFGLLAKRAYPTISMPWNETTSEVRDFVKKSKVPVVFDSGNFDPQISIMLGDSLYNTSLPQVSALAKNVAGFGQGLAVIGA